MTLLEPVLFRDGEPARRIDLHEAPDPGALVARHVGHFALHESTRGGEHWLARDLLGVHKLFFAVAEDGRVDSSNYFFELRALGHAPADIFSVPSGHFVRIDPRTRRYQLERWGALHVGPRGNPGRALRLSEIGARIRGALENTFELLARRFTGRPVYVTLSGGLDSTTIAALAREHFPDVRAVTFALRTPRISRGGDLFFARRVAAELRLPLFEVQVDPEQVLELLDDVLVYGQDWRDFNVHCGLVNAALGRAVAALHRDGPRPLTLTGDTMNELLADYAPVHLGGREYYALPQVDPDATRRFLVQGLDSGDREVGIFARFGLDTVQPYALCADEYAALPHELVCCDGGKARTVRAVMGRRVPESVYRRPKVRAQVAVDGEPGGVLALLVERGIDQHLLKSRFAELLGLAPGFARNLLRGGFYRFSTAYPEASTG
ncbi:MAG TPA: asparagine synthase-related protein [Planctomycetota bacterium]|nr:asparagine synthase-related protein [Planctomycetota bacterium]